DRTAATAQQARRSMSARQSSNPRAAADDHSWTTPLELVVDLEDVAEGPHRAEAVAPDREIDSHDHGVAQPCTKSETSTGVKIAEIERRLAGNHLACVSEHSHVQTTKDVPSVLGADKDAVVVVIAIAGEPPEIVVPSEGGHEEHRNRSTLVL